MNRADEPRATRVVVVRDAPRSVRPLDDDGRFGARTHFWAALAIGSLGLLWLTGHFGERLGFAGALGLPQLDLSTDAGLSSGVRSLIGSPRQVIAMAMAEPLALAPAFVLVSIPAAALAVAKPRVRGGPPSSALALGWARLGLVASCLVWAGLLAWLAWPQRRDVLAAIPLDRFAFGDWSRSVSVIAGADLFAWVASVLWLVLLFRMPLPRSAVAFAAVLGFAASLATWLGVAQSGGLDEGVRLPRPVLFVDREAHLMLGSVGGTPLLLSEGVRPAPILRAEVRATIAPSMSLVEWMRPRPDLDAAP